MNNFIRLVSFYTDCKHQKTKTISKNIRKQSLKILKASKRQNFKHPKLQTKQFLKDSNKVRFRFWCFFLLFWIFGLRNDLFQEKRFWKKNVSYTKIPASGNHKLSFWMKKKKKFNSFMTEVWKKNKNSPIICSLNQWTGFYMIVTSFKKELNNYSLFRMISLKGGNHFLMFMTGICFTTYTSV